MTSIQYPNHIKTFTLLKKRLASVQTFHSSRPVNSRIRSQQSLSANSLLHAQGTHVTLRFIGDPGKGW